MRNYRHVVRQCETGTRIILDYEGTLGRSISLNIIVPINIMFSSIGGSLRGSPDVYIRLPTYFDSQNNPMPINCKLSVTYFCAIEMVEEKVVLDNGWFHITT